MKINGEKFFLVLLRLSLGFLFLYTGLSKVLDPSWTSEGYLLGAEDPTSFYKALTHPSILPLVDFLNVWGQTLLGFSLITGLFLKISAPLGALLMLLYYFALPFPYPNEHAFIIDEHIIYACALLYLGAARAGKIWGLDRWIKNRFLQ